ncbi:Protein SMG7 [Dissostichus eleginoides]|uniref:Protein SMG7 n=1 Tax=Dissostichus eleginoides TaxID=100907 RepID=A0AAD9B9N2_DISEL|nr:Protein SMG7 [Dissostichus eleginoides]
MNLCAQYLRQAEALKADMTDSKLGAAEVWTSRQALQDLYQKMLVTDLEYALDKKNQITTLQSQAKNRANPNRSEVQANLSLFLEAASGFYTQLLQELCTLLQELCTLLQELCTVFNVDLPSRPSSCSYICQHCLVHLGDIGLTLRFTSLRSNSLRSNSLRSNSLRSNSLRFTSLRSNSLRSNSLRSNSLRSNSLRSNSLRFTSLRSNSLRSNSLRSTSLRSNSLRSTSLRFTSLRSNSLRSNSLRSNSLRSNSLRFTSLRSNSLRSTSLRSNSLRSNSLRSNSLRSTSLRSNSLRSTSLSARYRNQTSQAESYYRHAAQLVRLTKALSKALESRDEVKTKWSVSDFIRAFIKFHGHVYLSKSLDKLDALREKLEEQFQKLILQKAFSSQQLVHITVINLFELHHLRELPSEGGEPSCSEQPISWFQLLGLFMSFLGVMCSRALLNKSRGEEIMGECPLPAIKVSLDWLRLRPSVFHEAAVDQRTHIWPWLVSILNSFQPKEDDVTCPSVTPLPEEFELQGFLALRPALRSTSLRSNSLRSTSLRSTSLRSTSLRSNSLRSNSLRSTSLRSTSLRSNSLRSTSLRSNSLRSTSLRSTSLRSTSLRSNSLRSTSLRSNSLRSTSLRSTSLRSNSLRSTSLRSNSLRSTSLRSNSLRSTSLRSLDFTKGHQGILVDRDGLPLQTRHQRLISLGKWVADNQPGLIQCSVSEDGLLLFITDIPEQAIEEPLEKEKEAPVLQESSNAEQQPNDGLGNSGLKSVLSAGKTQSSWPDGGERPVVTFKENIKPREPSRSQQLKDSGKERRDFNKGNGAAAGKTEPKRERDGKRKSDMKKAPHEKTADAGKQVLTLFTLSLKIPCTS